MYIHYTILGFKPKYALEEFVNIGVLALSPQGESCYLMADCEERVANFFPNYKNYFNSWLKCLKEELDYAVTQITDIDSFKEYIKPRESLLRFSHAYTRKKVTCDTLQEFVQKIVDEVCFG